MNPALILLVLIALVALWFLLSFAFYPLGRILHRIWKDANEEINREDNTEKKENGGNN